MEQYICPLCSGFCKQSRINKEKRICTECNEIYEEKDVIIDSKIKNSWGERLDKKQKSIAVFELQGLGLSKGQIKQLLTTDKSVNTEELMIMARRGWSLPRVQELKIGVRMNRYISATEKNELLSEE